MENFFFLDLEKEAEPSLFILFLFEAALTFFFLSIWISSSLTFIFLSTYLMVFLISKWFLASSSYFLSLILNYCTHFLLQLYINFWSFYLVSTSFWYFSDWIAFPYVELDTSFSFISFNFLILFIKRWIWPALKLFYFTTFFSFYYFSLTLIFPSSISIPSLKIIVWRSSQLSILLSKGADNSLVSLLTSFFAFFIFLLVFCTYYSSRTP